MLSKRRKGYRPITVDGENLIYRVSVQAGAAYFYDTSEARHEVKFDLHDGPNIKDLTDKDWETAWRGKNADGAWSKKTLAALWRDYKISTHHSSQS